MVLGSRQKRPGLLGQRINQNNDSTRSQVKSSDLFWLFLYPRRRSLKSLSFLSMHSHVDTSEGDAAQSHLGTLAVLPAEIRKSVYDYYFFSDDNICRVFQPSCQDPSEEWIIPSIFPSCSHTNPLRGSLKGLPLLLTSRQV